MITIAVEECSGLTATVKAAASELLSFWMCSSCLTAGTPAFGPGVALTSGLIPAAAFPALIDGSWGDHGWTVTDGMVPADDPDPAPLEWDRTA